MHNQRGVSKWRNGLTLMLILLLSSLAFAKDKKPNKNDVCAQPNPQLLCTPENTCGSGSATCTLDVTRTATSSSLKSNTPSAKSANPICIAAGTKVDWTSTEKETGFIVDAGASSAFEPGGAIIGGVGKPVSTVAMKEGCYQVSYGACKSGGIYGMCKESSAAIIITKGK